MPANSINRKDTRAAMATLLATKLETTNDFADGKLCRKVYGYLVGDLKEGLPAVCVSVLPDGGTERSKQTFQAVEWSKNAVHLVLTSFVDYAKEDGTWTEAQAQDRLDDIEKQIADALIDNRFSAGNWQDIAFEGRSRPAVALIDGSAYLTEDIHIVMAVMK